MIKKHRWEIISDIILENNYRIIAEIGVSRGDNARGILGCLKKNRYVLGKFYLVDIPEYDKKEERYLFDSKRLESSYYIPIGSESASKIIENNHLDLIFIDADTSSYESVKKDIELWLPKLKKNGSICGRYFTMTDNHIEQVILEIFKSNYTLYPLIEKCSGIEDYLWVYKND